jgi:hypothetical protein
MSEKASKKGKKKGGGKGAKASPVRFGRARVGMPCSRGRSSTWLTLLCERCSEPAGTHHQWQ